MALQKQRQIDDKERQAADYVKRKAELQEQISRKRAAEATAKQNLEHEEARVRAKQEAAEKKQRDASKKDQEAQLRRAREISREAGRTAHLQASVVPAVSWPAAEAPSIPFPAASLEGEEAVPGKAPPHPRRRGRRPRIITGLTPELSERRCLEILALFRKGHTVENLAKQYGESISSIRRWRDWGEQIESERGLP